MVSIFTPIVLVLVVVMMVLTGSAGAVTTLEITHGFAALILPGQANDVSWSFGGVDWHTSGSNAGLSFDLSTGFIEIEGVSYVQCPNNPFSPPPCDQHSNIDLGGNFDEPFQWLHEASVTYDAGLPPLPGPPDISGTFRTAGELFLLDASGGLVHFHIVGQGISQIQWLSLGSEFPPDFPCALRRILYPIESELRPSICVPTNP